MSEFIEIRRSIRVLMNTWCNRWWSSLTRIYRYSLSFIIIFHGDVMTWEPRWWPINKPVMWTFDAIGQTMVLPLMLPTWCHSNKVLYNAAWCQGVFQISKKRVSSWARTNFSIVIVICHLYTKAGRKWSPFCRGYFPHSFYCIKSF